MIIDLYNYHTSIFMNELFETNRIMLILSNPNLDKQVLDYYTKNKDFLKQVEPIREDSFYTLEFQRKELIKDVELQTKGTNYKYWIVLKKSKKIIGYVAFNNIVMGPFKSCFLSYALDKDNIKQGLMSECVQKAIEIAFDKIGLHRIEANIMPDNIASLKVVKKLGFINEGLARDYLFINGQWRDHIHMVLINKDYKE